MTFAFKELQVYQKGLDFYVNVVGATDAGIKTNEVFNPSSLPYDGLGPVSEDL